ncbi:hypothetical protein [Agrobacterium radiobacter]|uniref:hypothetical protein n=1 Tax=Agrobacterium radiobacter TaxID=362 RepID=UPI0007616A23|nr:MULTISPECIES: hypothetical protein [Agrobacterium tumefaciens complex]KAB0459787.1 hypothetical protein F7R04_12820 [Agrobacterium tumefaciens]KWT77077.1 hypothetical protein ASH09_12105 [Agrobacterium radiobacter]NIB11129.1 hypothetical protein [Agrobacterium radiobacter]OOO38269.1 hypothetical protein BS628_08945 [Agrobacterium radiobacter]
MMQGHRLLDWERDDTVAGDTNGAWTNLLIVGDGEEDTYDILVLGAPGRIGPTHYSVTGTRNRTGVTFAEGHASSWDEACRLAIIQARRASIRPVE